MLCHGQSFFGPVPQAVSLKFLRQSAAKTLTGQRSLTRAFSLCIFVKLPFCMSRLIKFVNTSFSEGDSNSYLLYNIIFVLLKNILAENYINRANVKKRPPEVTMHAAKAVLKT